jgi:hypothetical protein
MKKKLFTLFLSLIGIALIARSQSVEESFKNINNCIDIEIEAMHLVPQFYFKKQFDSIELTLDYVKMKCVESESLRMTRFLLAIQNGSFTETTLDSRDIYLIKKESKRIRHGHLYDFHHFVLSSSFATSDFSRNNNPWTRGELERRMIETLIGWSTQLINKGGRNSLELSVLEHIRALPNEIRKGSRLFREVNKSKYRNSPLRQTYDQYHDLYVMNRALHFGIAYTHWMQRVPAEKFTVICRGYM